MKLSLAITAAVFAIVSAVGFALATTRPPGWNANRSSRSRSMGSWPAKQLEPAIAFDDDETARESLRRRRARPRLSRDRALRRERRADRDARSGASSVAPADHESSGARPERCG